MPITDVKLRGDILARLIVALSKITPGAVDCSMRKIVDYCEEFKAIPAYTDANALVGKLVIFAEITAAGKSE